MASVYKALSNTTNKKEVKKSDESKENRQRVLMLTSRGVTYRHRHLLNDLHAMMPHARKESKLDTKTKLFQLNELAELYNCNNVLYFEARKGKDLYAWMSKPPNGPTVKFHVQNLHTMDELHFTGNCLKGSRPILSFDAAFDSEPHLQVIKELFLHTYGVPKGARKSKPFIDHVMGFTVADGRIWIRCYQINETEESKQSQPVPEGGSHMDVDEEESSGKAGKGGKKGETGITLVEIGPRFVLTPIVILEGSFGGPVIYENKEFVSPNAIRSDLRRKKANKFNVRTQRGIEGKAHRDELGLETGGKKNPKSPLDHQIVFA